MGVFEFHDERTLDREDLEQPSDRPRGVGAARIAHTEELRESFRDRGAVRMSAAGSGALSDLTGLTRREILSCDTTRPAART